MIVMTTGELTIDKVNDGKHEVSVTSKCAIKGCLCGACILCLEAFFRCMSKGSCHNIHDLELYFGCVLDLQLYMHNESLSQAWSVWHKPNTLKSTQQV